MRDHTSPSLWLGRAALVGWLAVGVASVLLAPTKEPPAPAYAELVFGAAPSMQSSATAGLLALARLLERQGFDVQPYAGYAPPAADVWIMVAPKIGLSDEEIEALLAWIRAGGRLIYAPVIVTLTGADTPTVVGEDESSTEPRVEKAEPARRDREEKRIRLDLSLQERLSSQAQVEASLGGAALSWTIGRGRVAWLDNGAAPLANGRLQKEGISPELPWLTWILDGERTVVFDEGRLGLAESEGLLSLLSRSPFAPGLRLALVALLLGLVAAARRRYPARTEEAAGSRVFGEHIDAVARLLARGERVQLAARLLFSGTLRRLGPLTELVGIRRRLEDAQQSLRQSPTALTLTAAAETMRQLEARSPAGPGSLRSRHPLHYGR